MADKKAGYAWRTAASLSEPGFDADMWIGNACVTGSGRRAVVAYAPRTFTNKPELMARGAFAAVVDLVTGKVTKLDRQVSLAYFSPGCGLGETAVFTQLGGETKNATRLVKVNATTARLGKPVQLKGQVTSAVPVGDAIVAADGARLVKITGSGRRTAVARTNQVPFLLKPDSQGGVVYMDRTAAAAKAAGRAQGQVKRVTAAHIAGPNARKAKPAVLASGPLTNMDVTAGADGTVFVTGGVTPAPALPASVKVRADMPRDSVATTRSEALVTRTAWADSKDPRAMLQLAARSRIARISLQMLGEQVKADFEVAPDQIGVARTIQGRALSPALPHPAKASKATGRSGAGSASALGIVDDGRYCSVPRNDPAKQTMQPKPRQVEWAVNMAVTGNLNRHISRPANWKNLGMPAYQPQASDMFPLTPLAGGGRIPMQVMLGITAQESNMWQASRIVVPGVTGNPLIGNYYGIKYAPNGQQQDPWGINWAEADCGYGITQVTDGMRVHGKEKPGESPKTTKQQEAIALDYTVNVAAGVNILAEKWNQTYSAGLKVDNAKPHYLENWYFALWAYNSGFYPQSNAWGKDSNGKPNDGAWGVGFTNNPGNPLWKANRVPFLSNSTGTGDDYSHAAHPQDWPYQEKVLGWAARPLQALESPGTMVVGFRPAWWTSNPNRWTVKAPEGSFCTTANWCDPSKIGPNDSNDPGMGACTRTDLKCWWNQPVSWKSCDQNLCGSEVWRFDPPENYGEQADGSAYPPACSTNGLPANALVVDNVPSGTPIHRPNCTSPASQGTFSFEFGSPSAKIDLHQVGAAFGSHFWFTHTRKSGAEGGRLATTGTWRLSRSLDSWTRILVHLPDHGAHTQQAKYEIDLGSGNFTRTRYINQKRMANNWVSLGVYKVNGVPRVQLSSVTEDGIGEDDVAWDSVAFQPLPAKPQHIVAALGDSYTSGEGAGSYYPETDSDHGDAQRWNACRRSKNAWPRKIVLPGTNSSLGSLTDSWSNVAELGFVACSGARTGNVWDHSWAPDTQPFSEGQFHEAAQVRSGVLSADTTLVMLTLGGNDGGAFTRAVVECGAPVPDCAKDESFLPRYKKLIDEEVIPALRVALGDIVDEAPNAQIVLMGYPELFSRTVKCSGSAWWYGGESDALAELVNYAGTKQRALADSLRTGIEKFKIEFADPVPTFVGHGGCDSDEWINLIVGGPVGNGDFHLGDPVTKDAHSCPLSWLTDICLSRESFHPKSAGTSGYSSVMQARLGQIGYKGT